MAEVQKRGSGWHAVTFADDTFLLTLHEGKLYQTSSPFTGPPHLVGRDTIETIGSPPALLLPPPRTSSHADPDPALSIGDLQFSSVFESEESGEGSLSGDDAPLSQCMLPTTSFAWTYKGQVLGKQLYYNFKSLPVEQKKSLAQELLNVSHACFESQKVRNASKALALRTMGDIYLDMKRALSKPEGERESHMFIVTGLQGDIQGACLCGFYDGEVEVRRLASNPRSFLRQAPFGEQIAAALLQGIRKLMSEREEGRESPCGIFLQASMGSAKAYDAVQGEHLQLPQERMADDKKLLYVWPPVSVNIVVA